MGLTSRHFVTVTSVFISWIKYCIVLLIALVFFFSTCVVSSRLLPQFVFYFYWVLFLREKEKREVNREGRTYTQATLYFLVIFSYFIVWLNTGIPVASFINYHISLFKSTCKRQNRAASGVYIMQARRRNGGNFLINTEILQILIITHFAKWTTALLDTGLSFKLAVPWRRINTALILSCASVIS